MSSISPVKEHSTHTARSITHPLNKKVLELRNPFRCFSLTSALGAKKLNGIAAMFVKCIGKPPPTCTLPGLTVCLMQGTLFGPLGRLLVLSALQCACFCLHRRSVLLPFCLVLSETAAAVCSAVSLCHAMSCAIMKHTLFRVTPRMNNSRRGSRRGKRRNEKVAGMVGLCFERGVDGSSVSRFKNKDVPAMLLLAC